MAAEGDGRAAMLADLEDAGIKLTSVAAAYLVCPPDPPTFFARGRRRLRR